MAVPVLQDLIERGEEEDACVELLSTILEVLYAAQKVAPSCSLLSVLASPWKYVWLLFVAGVAVGGLRRPCGLCADLQRCVCCREQRRSGAGSAVTRSW